MSVPKPEVRRSRPHISTMAGEVTAHQAERKAPNMTETITKAQYSSQNGMARGAIPPTPGKEDVIMILSDYHELFVILPRAMKVTTRALTPGRSVSIPERILQIVLQMPTMEMRKEALTLEMPWDLARLGRNM